jgi:hypothetical protein
MVPLLSLWLPVLVSAGLVFIASFVIHMVLPYHRSDYRQLPAETDVMEALRKFGIPPGDYVVPHAGGPEGMKSQAFKEKMLRGPVIVMTVIKNGEWDMGSRLVQWFIYCIAVGFVAAYVTSRAVGPGTEYLARRLPFRRLHGVRRVRPRALAEHHLVQARVDDHAQVEHRRADLWAAHRRRVRLALAQVGPRAQGQAPR